MTDRLTEIKARVAEGHTHACRTAITMERPCTCGVSDLEYALGEIGRLKGEVVIEREHYDLICEQVNGLVLQRDRMHAALKGISKLGNLTLLGGSAMDSERAHEAGAHEAFSQAADIARSALGADYVQEG